MNKSISLSDVSFKVGPADATIEILKDVSFEASPQQLIAIHGRSGSGKSTLLSIISGLQSATSGEVNVLGMPFHQYSDEQRTSARRGRIGFVYQDFQLLPNLNAWENAVLPLRLLGRKVDKDSVSRRFAEFGLGERAGHFPAQLSGGEQQRVAIMRALLIEPDIILADEPTGNLDQKTAKSFIEILRQAAKDDNHAVVVVTHDEHIISVADERLELF